MGPYPKFSSYFFGRKFFYGREIISSKTCPKQKFSTKFIYGRKIKSSKTGPYKNFRLFFWSKIYLWSENHFFENGSLPKISIENFFAKMFYGRKIISSKTGPTKNFHLNIFMVAK
jgi:hypothetical protein